MTLRTSLTSLSLLSSPPPPPCPKPSLHILKTPLSSFCSSSSPYLSTIKKQKSNSTSTSTWLTHWAPPPHSSSSSTVDLSSSKTKPTQSNGHHQYNHQNSNTTTFKTKNTRTFNNNSKNKNSKSKSENAVERIVFRLRNLGLTPEEEEEGEEEEGEEVEKDYDTTQNEHEEVVPVEGEVVGFGEEKLSDLLKREWIRPDTILSESDDDEDDVALPWEREVEGVGGEEGGKGKKRGFVAKAPTLAELTVEDEELRRLRREGMCIRDRITVAKAGITRDVLEKIHDKWRKYELVRLKFHEVLARDMKTAHEITEVVSSLLFLFLF